MSCRIIPTLWQKMETLPAGTELFTRVLTCLDAVSIARLLQVEKRSRRSVRKLFSTIETIRSRVALASLCFSRLRVEFQAYYQVLETQNIPRSNDPRVPPRVAGGAVSLKPVELPDVHANGLTAHFLAASNTAGNRPMLMNVVQTNRRIYTMITVKLLQSGDNQDRNDTSTELVLRSYSYLKEFGEWKTPTLPEKHKLAAANFGSHRGQFDLISQDGSVVLGLEVPRGTDAQMDYYLVKQATVSIHIQELLQVYFISLRPIKSLPEPSHREACNISITLRSIAGKLVTRCCVPGYITRTGIENFEVVNLPTDPGYAWLEVRSMNEAALSRRSCLYYYAVALHHGAKKVPGSGDSRAMQFNWLPGLLESFPTLESRQRRCLKGNLRMMTSSNGSMLQELTLVAQRLPTARLERYAARIESYTRHES
ncbi:uncharacterized protein PITG_18210 [Phytophthora infestans T30-4]|uniref:Uncharacterized protein n=1 Tax=Phytophthora infestans (strain T30-4) TaxID=403677 RepID=D0NXM2_PHYIT|nr:uncharacterized protein PITG_18210 [Phytophthora infestans T30-4]EEY67822.1 conserved hypothetical protein [Phytophthora infestans T30-4]|eukprot:XP_002997847.1 conserved hypothetical protein [Phytophthora infestans T30-4]